MRWLPAFVSALCATGTLAAKKSTEQRFTEFHTKSLASSPVKLLDASYRELTSAPRDYTAAILLTALDARFGCQLCREFQPEWDLLSKSWVKGDKSGDSRLILATLDFSDGRDIFMSLGLQTAPVLFLFPPTIGPHAAASPEPIRYDFVNGPQSAEQVHAWLSRHLPDRPHPPVKRPINWIKWIFTTTMLAGSLTAAVVAWPYVLPIIQNRNVWAAISLISILLFTSGHMFNRIRGVPYVSGDGRGGITYFASGFQNQFGMETQIVAAMYGVLSFAAIALTVKVPRIADAKAQGVAVLAWGGAMFLMYSFLLSIFRVKNGGYPFSLPPFM
ncbi:dolichyl-diphosphooligosaccharide-protein glycotransferase [Cercophora newfieldiana]|uniref:Dolichyl-diphosphooligosaccharide-protein glycotransferase n=1 Tax=Cercophora newfieldiana TaxID=92897 RepID=A0AA40CP23_9PEZI|nr:dolichyl-diphosphooligosaccharide-protein glycotransferase [Cercophora newfieldiana]